MRLSIVLSCFSFPIGEPNHYFSILPPSLLTKKTDCDSVTVFNANLIHWLFVLNLYNSRKMSRRLGGNKKYVPEDCPLQFCKAVFGLKVKFQLDELEMDNAIIFCLFSNFGNQYVGALDSVFCPKWNNLPKIRNEDARSSLPV